MKKKKHAELTLVTLADLFEFTPDDLESNRAGRVSPGQRAQIQNLQGQEFNAMIFGFKMMARAMAMTVSHL